MKQAGSIAKPITSLIRRLIQDCVSFINDNISLGIPDGSMEK
jgi:hypothetical protein